MGQGGDQEDDHVGDVLRAHQLVGAIVDGDGQGGQGGLGVFAHGGRHGRGDVAGGHGVDAHAVGGPGSGHPPGPAGQGVLRCDVNAVAHGEIGAVKIVQDVQDALLVDGLGLAVIEHIHQVHPGCALGDGVGRGDDAVAALLFQ